MKDFKEYLRIVWPGFVAYYLMIGVLMDTASTAPYTIRIDEQFPLLRWFLRLIIVFICVALIRLYGKHVDNYVKNNKQ